MNEQVKINIKQRIVGAIVLVSLGIIVIPLLLDGGKEQQPGISNSNIPILPSHLDREIAPLTEPKPIYKPQPVMVRPVDKLSNEATETPDVAKTGQQSLHSKTARVQAKKTPAKKGSPSEKKSSSPAVNYQIASKPKTSRIETAYTIQVGSFSKKSNAFSLRNKLRQDKFRAYIESITLSAGVRYRVRVGPFLKYDEVKKNRDKLLRQHKLKGTIVKYKT